MAKQGAFVRIIANLNQSRYKVKTGLDAQDVVYMTKKIQAQAFKDSGYEEHDLLKFPYVLQYAEYAGLSAKVATDEILFKAALDDQFLADTELLRLRYLNKVKVATELEELPKIFEEFLRDSYVFIKPKRA